MDGRVYQTKHGDVTTVEVELTRRNLVALLSKLDGHPVGSARTISKLIGDRTYIVQAVEDFAHYGGGIDPGPMHDDTERAISNHYAIERGEVCRCTHCQIQNEGGE